MIVVVVFFHVLLHCRFRASALKWHPDKHQGDSQTMASEKFKSCVEAYKSLSDAFGAT